jgi:hypothetical protein
MCKCIHEATWPWETVGYVSVHTHSNLISHRTSMRGVDIGLRREPGEGCEDEPMAVCTDVFEAGHVDLEVRLGIVAGNKH